MQIANCGKTSTFSRDAELESRCADCHSGARALRAQRLRYGAAKRARAELRLTEKIRQASLQTKSVAHGASAQVHSYLLDGSPQSEARPAITKSRD
jgi:hypothetical protein